MRTKDKEKLDAIYQCVEQYYEEYQDTPTIDEIAKLIKISRATVHRYLIELEQTTDLRYLGKKGILTDKIVKMKKSSVNVALVGSIACGGPTFAEENIEEYFSLPEKLIGSGKFFLLRASGNSMIKAGIESGDLVLIKQQNYADPGDIVVALCDNYDTTLKRFYPEEDGVRLHPENDEMDDIYVRDCAIQGVAIKVLKDI